ncbi:alpha/beta-hydrolase [Rhizodiscina lignyota]|uniref:Alpha/beta-hydrolase n=1 Tax=Rhizodiscina lignyota TaxID=1504668 RepID=A0A9P4IGP8_9PEZI|nr:alpha/beta-hydrolase [Rhizodiscina lignyota]
MAPPTMAREWNEFAKSYSVPSPSSIQEFRAQKLERMLKTQGFLKDPNFAVLAIGAKVENTQITLPEVAGHKFGLRIYRPARETAATLPIMLYFHGGYWCAGDANSEDFGCRAIVARGTDIIILSFEYRLIPEVKWHTVFSDAEYAMKWAALNASSYGGDTSKGFLIGGADAGAHLAAICAVRARDKYPNIKLTGQNLIVPTFMVWPDEKIPESWRSRLSSHTENADAPVLNQKLFEMFLSALNVPEDEQRKGENFPTWADLKGLPPAYLPMDECDPIRDHGFLYAELLRDAGVLTRTDYYRGLPNMFVQFPELPMTAIAGFHLSAAIKWLLQERK